MAKKQVKDVEESEEPKATKGKGKATKAKTEKTKRYLFGSD
jgi:hypothetical protein